MFESGFQLGMSQGFGGLGTQIDSETAKKSRVEDKQQVLPVTVKAVEEAVAASGGKGGAELKFYAGPTGEPSQLLIVGVVERLSKQATSMEMTLNDGTGRIKARYFIPDSAGGESDPSKLIQEGAYVSAVGAVRVAPEVHLGLIAIRPVHSADEVSYHTIECGHAALRIRRGPEALPPPAPTQAQTAPTPQPQQPQQQTPQPLKTAVPTAVGVPVDDPVALQAAVLKAIQNGAAAAGEVGVSVAAISAAVAAGEMEVRKALGSLVDSADVFNTVDDDHFCPL